MRIDEDRDPFIDLIAGIGPDERDGTATTTVPSAGDREVPPPTGPAAAS